MSTYHISFDSTRNNLILASERANLAAYVDAKKGNIEWTFASPLGDGFRFRSAEIDHGRVLLSGENVGESDDVYLLNLKGAVIAWKEFPARSIREYHRTNEVRFLGNHIAVQTERAIYVLSSP